MSRNADNDILPNPHLPPIPDLASHLSEAATISENDSRPVESKPDRAPPAPKTAAPDPGATTCETADASAIAKTLCTICYDAPATAADTAVVPSCGHTFCLPCLISWTSVRPVCPNCKQPFRTVLTHRDPGTGVARAAAVETDAQRLRAAPWLALREIHSPQHDIEAAFTLPPLDDTLNDHVDHATALLQARAAAAAAASAQVSARAPRSRPVAIDDEDVEDELEQRFWADEQDQHDRLMRSTRVIHNRRLGPGGFIAAGRAFATPRRVPSGPASAGSASQHASGAAPRRAEKKAGAKGGEKPVQTGGRKKKVKKKSRAGIAKEAAAKAAREAAEKEAATAAAEAGATPGRGVDVASGSSNAGDGSATAASTAAVAS